MTLHEPPPTPGDGPAAAGGTESDRLLEQTEMAGVIGSPWGRAARLGALLLALVALGLWRGLPIVVVILAIVVMIFLHELGHFLAARWSGMLATEFFIGFGPRIWSFRRGETEYGIKAIPAGAYVKILGMNNLEEVDPADEARTYRQAPFRSRFNVAVAGSAMHFAVALVLLVVQFSLIGAPDGNKWNVAEVTPGSAAAAAGMRSGDRIVSLDGRPVGAYSGFRSQIRSADSGRVEMVVDRDGRRVTLPVDLSRRAAVIGTVGEDLDLVDDGSGLVVGNVRPDGRVASSGLAEGAKVTSVNGVSVRRADDVAAAVEKSRGGNVSVTTVQDGSTRAHQVDLGSAVSSTEPTAFLGVAKGQVLATQALPVAVGSSFAEFGRTVGASVAGVATVLWPPNLVDFFTSTATGSEPKDPASTPTPAEQTPTGAAQSRPVSILGIVQIGSDATAQNWSNLIGFLIGLNIILGVFNLIPLLPFDGGHVAIATYEKAQEMRRRQSRRYMADISRMLPAAYGVMMVLGLVFFFALYLDITKGISA